MKYMLWRFVLSRENSKKAIFTKGSSNFTHFGDLFFFCFKDFFYFHYIKFSLDKKKNK